MTAEVSMDGPRADVLAEALRMVRMARERGVAAYLLGGVAIAVRRGDRPALLQREFKDIDLFTLKSESKRMRQLLESAGYRADREFNAMNGRRRLLFWDDNNGRQVDVFVEEFEMSHRLPLAEAVVPGEETISLADLLATKLQIYELNPKDQLDIFNLLHDHPVSDRGGNPDAINTHRLAVLCAQDWPFWRTTKLNVERTLGALETGVITDHAAASVIRERLDRIWEAIERQPRSSKWKLRDRLGDRVRWYELPDEVR